MFNIFLITLSCAFLLGSIFFIICGISQVFNFKYKHNVFITAKVKDYEIEKHDTGIDVDLFPVYEFELNGELREYTAQTFTNVQKYQLGEEVKLCYNPKKNAFVHPDDVYFSFNLAAILLSVALFILGIPLINFGIL